MSSSAHLFIALVFWNNQTKKILPRFAVYKACAFQHFSLVASRALPPLKQVQWVTPRVWKKGTLP